MNGERLRDGEPDPWPPPNGAYWRMHRRVGSRELVWYVMTPNGMFGCLASHQVVEHEDRTITVSPSILVTQNNEPNGVVQWHGFLERGVWREC